MNLLDMLEPLPGQSLDTPLFAYQEKDSDVVLSRTQFRNRAHAIANRLSEVAARGDRVLLVFPPGPEFLCAFAGALSAGMVAVPVYPPDGRPNSVERFFALITDARVSVALGTEDVCAQTALVPDLAKLRWLATDSIPESSAAGYIRPDIDPASLAFIQYTSGSTGLPRGVMHTHRNVLANMDLIRRTLQVERASRGVIWLPLYHDMGLITALMSVHHAEYMRLMSPLSFLRDPIAWLRHISRDNASHSGGPNFAYDLCVRKCKPSDIATLDLRCWTHAFNGAEPIRAQTLERFAETFGPCGFKRSAFLPCYGLAEATLLVSVGPAATEPTVRAVDEAALLVGRALPSSDGARARSLVASGNIHDSAEVAIVDPQTGQRREPQRIGEIWVRGPGIGAGYFGREDETERTFRARLQPSGEGPYLRTGDLGFVRDGQLFVTGRLKDLIVIRGENYYPQDLEAIIANAHHAVRQGCCVAVALQGAETEELALFLELDKSQEDVVVSQVLTNVREAISEQCALAPQVIAVVKRGSLPKTSSGKLQRSQCRDAFLRGTLPVLASYDTRSGTARPSGNDDGGLSHGAGAEERQKAALIAAVQARLLTEIRAIVKEPVDAESVVTRLGITSLSAIEIMFAIEQEFGLTIPPEYLADSISVRELATRVVLGEDAPQAATRASVSEVAPAKPSPRRPLEFSLMYFSTDTQEVTDARYSTMLRTARFADEHGFKALWLPERHFHPFGGAYPNPSVAAGALAMATKRVRIRAGSIVVPLHSPIRVVEEWSMVDNLSGGRVDVSFAKGWNANDFVLAPGKYEDRHAVTFEGIEQIRRLWSGGRLEAKNGRGEPAVLSIHPPPVQRELGTWLTCTGSPESFAEAGARGYNVLSALLFQRVDELATKIALYRSERARHGHDPNGGVVTLMLHAFVGRSNEEVRRKVAEPFKRYLASSIDLWKHEWLELGKDGTLSAELLDMAFERYARGNALFGTASSCADLVGELNELGVDEIACLVDFGVAEDEILDSLVYLDDLRLRASDRRDHSRLRAAAL